MTDNADLRRATTPSRMAGYGTGPEPAIPADATVLTLGELRAFTAHLPDDVQVLVATDDWYQNAPEIQLPETEEGTHGHQAVTLYPADTFDPRQF